MTSGYAPDTIECVLQFGEYRGSADTEQSETDQCCCNTFSRAIDAFEQALNRSRTAFTHEFAQLPEDLPTRCLLTKCHAGNGDNNQQQWCYRKQRVVGKCGAHAGCVIINPRLNGGADESPGTLKGHVIEALLSPMFELIVG